MQLPERIKQVKRKVFTPAQVQMLINAATPEWKTAMLLGYYAGLRLSDCVTLTWQAVDLAGGKIVGGNSQDRRQAGNPVAPDAGKTLDQTGR